MPQSKGHLNPGSPGVELERFEVGSDLAELIRHVWIARWRLPQGETRRQRVLAYPAFNLVIMDASAALYGPNPRLQLRDLVGAGWAVGLLLRPAAGRLLSPVAPAELVGKSLPIRDVPIAAVAATIDEASHASMLSGILSRWLGPTAACVDQQGQLVNRICQLAEEDDSIVRVSDLARRVGVSARTLERLIVRHIGVAPKWLIECRRLQEAATTLHARPRTDLTALALDLRYADYSHFSRRYKEVIGETPDQTRAQAEPSTE